MAFHDVRFPTDISRGSRGGPGFFVNIAETDSGSDERVNRWPLPKRQYNIRYGIRTQNDLFRVLDFFIAREGPTNGFRFKDWLDYTTGIFGRATPTNADELIGTGDGSTQSFQLIKTYAKGGIYAKQRPIEKPVAGTVLVALDGTNTTAFSVDTSTGIVTMNSAPGAGVSVTAGCEFDVPVQFGPAFAAGALQASLDNFETGAIPDIQLEEMNSGVQAPEAYFHGGGRARALTGDTRFEWSWGMANVLVPTTALKIILPDTLDLPAGGNYPYFFNAASSAITITFRDASDSNTLWQLNQNIGAISLIYKSSGLKFWGAIGA